MLSRSADDEIWLILIEKAYAKMYGGYNKIQGGDPSIAMKDITGAPYSNIDFLHPESLF